MKSVHRHIRDNMLPPSLLVLVLLFACGHYPDSVESLKCNATTGTGDCSADETSCRYSNFENHVWDKTKYLDCNSPFITEKLNKCYINFFGASPSNPNCYKIPRKGSEARFHDAERACGIFGRTPLEYEATTDIVPREGESEVIYCYCSTDYCNGNITGSAISPSPPGSPVDAEGNPISRASRKINLNSTICGIAIMTVLLLSPLLKEVFFHRQN